MTNKRRKFRPMKACMFCIISEKVTNWSDCRRILNSVYGRALMTSPPRLPVNRLRSFLYEKFKI